MNVFLNVVKNWFNWLITLWILSTRSIKRAWSWRCSNSWFDTSSKLTSSLSMLVQMKKEISSPSLICLCRQLSISLAHKPSEVATSTSTESVSTTQEREASSSGAAKDGSNFLQGRNSRTLSPMYQLVISQACASKSAHLKSMVS